MHCVPFCALVGLHLWKKNAANNAQQGQPLMVAACSVVIVAAQVDPGWFGLASNGGQDDVKLGIHNLLVSWSR